MTETALQFAGWAFNLNTNKFGIERDFKFTILKSSVCGHYWIAKYEHFSC